MVRRDRWFGRTVWATAVLVVEDRPGLFVSYAPPGSESMVATSESVIADVAAGRWDLTRTARYNHTLAIYEPGESFAVLVFFDESWTPLCWYVNAEAPHVRTPITYDTQDHQLDVVMSLDRSSWEWKDEDHVAAAVDAGLYDAPKVQAIRAACDRGIERVRSGAEPYSAAWLRWRPDPSWSVPALPAGWDDA